MTCIETPRLFLRPWQEADAPALYRYASDPRIGPCCGWEPHPNVEHSLEILRKILIDENTWALTLKGSGEAIGSIACIASPNSQAPGEPEIGYWLGVPFWGRGYMPEAVTALLGKLFRDGNSRVWCAHFDWNDRSRRVIEKCGFVYRFSEPFRSEQTGEVQQALYYALTAPNKGAEL